MIDEINNCPSCSISETVTWPQIHRKITGASPEMSSELSFLAVEDECRVNLGNCVWSLVSWSWLKFATSLLDQNSLIAFWNWIKFETLDGWQVKSNSHSWTVVYQFVVMTLKLDKLDCELVLLKTHTLNPLIDSNLIYLVKHLISKILLFTNSHLMACHDTMACFLQVVVELDSQSISNYFPLSMLWDKPVVCLPCQSM